MKKNIASLIQRGYDGVMNYSNVSLYNIDSRAGFDLARLRDMAGIKQSEIAKVLRVDASRVSRIETGKDIPEISEIVDFANAIGTDEAKEYADYCQQKWIVIEQPSFWHPSRKELRFAEEILTQLEEFVRKSETSEAAKAQANLHRKSMSYAVDYLRDIDHSIAFVGDVMVGKSTGISGITNLLLPIDSTAPVSLSKRVVLEAGGGHTTLCEVQLRSEDDKTFGIVVHPHSQEEIFRTVSDFSTALVDLYQTLDNSGGSLANDGEKRDISEEINKALRNMAGLTRRTGGKSVDGKVVRIDPAMELIRECNGSLTEFTAEVLKRIRLDQRTTTEFRFEATDLSTGLRQIREWFAKINKGLAPEFSLPHRIDVIVPIPLLGKQPFNIRVIDTKGVDDTAIRPDIKAYLDDPRVVTVLCSKFGTAPDLSLQILMENLVSTGMETALSERVVLLVLARSHEVMDMPDDMGNPVETAEEVYQIKYDVIRSELARISGARDIPILFFDVLNDDHNVIAKNLANIILSLRDSYSKRIAEVSQTIVELIRRHGEAQTKEAQEKVRHRLGIFIGQHLSIGEKKQKPYQGFISAIAARHHRTVWASTRRNGSWPGLDAYHLIGAGTAIDARNRTYLAATGFDELLSNMLGDTELEPAHDYLNELRRAAQNWRQEFLNAVTISGREIFRAELFADDKVWDQCVDLWGDGLGRYRVRVGEVLEEWCVTHPHLSQSVERQIQQAWKDLFLRPLATLCESLELLDKDPMKVDP